MHSNHVHFAGETGLSDGLADRLHRPGFVVLDPDIGSVDRQKSHQDTNSGNDAVGLLKHQPIVGGDVRFTFRPIDQQRAHRAVRRAIELHLRRKRRPSEANDPRLRYPFQHVVAGQRIRIGR